MRTRYRIHSKGPEHPYFVTSTMVAWIPVFTHKDHFEILASSLEYCRKEKYMRLYAYVIMDNHIHLIASSPDLSKTMQSFKSFTARRLIESMTHKKMEWLLHQLAYHKAGHKQDSEFQVWQEGFHPEEIGSAEMFRQKVAYLYYNPVRRGYVAKPEHWQYSSAGQLLAGEKGVVEVGALPFM